MLMDSSFWKTINPDIKLKNTTKRFYKQFIFKLEIEAHGCNSLRYDDVKMNFDYRMKRSNIIPTNRIPYFEQLREELKKADLGFLLELRSIIESHTSIRVRYSEPNLAIYADNEAVLVSFVNAISPQYRDKITTITLPESKDKANLLTTDVVIVKKEPKYKFRVIFRESRYDQETRTRIFNFLTAQEEMVLIPPHTVDQLSKSHDWIWGCYYKTNDIMTVDLLRLICPTIVREINEYVCAK